MLRFILAILALGILVQPAWTQDTIQPLTDKEINGWIDSLEEIIKRSTEQEGQYRELADEWSNVDFTKAGADYSAALEAIGASGEAINEDVLRIARKNGFEDMAHWNGVGERVMTAFIAVKYEEQQPKIEEGLEAVFSSMKAFLSEDQQQEMQAQIDSTKAAILNAYGSVPDSDITKVKKQADLLETILTGGGGGAVDD